MNRHSWEWLAFYAVLLVLAIVTVLVLTLWW